MGAMCITKPLHVRSAYLTWLCPCLDADVCDRRLWTRFEGTLVASLAVTHGSEIHPDWAPLHPYSTTQISPLRHTLTQTFPPLHLSPHPFTPPNITTLLSRLSTTLTSKTPYSKSASLRHFKAQVYKLFNFYIRYVYTTLQLIQILE